MRRRVRSSRLFFSVVLLGVLFFSGVTLLPSETLDIYRYTHAKVSEPNAGLFAGIKNTFSVVLTTGQNALAQSFSAVASEYPYAPGKQVLIHLDAEEVVVLLNGRVLDEFTLLSVAEKDSPHAPRQGTFYSVKKEAEHFSPFLKKWFPYTISISENMFMHADIGTDVQGTFVLSPKAARSIFAFVDGSTVISIVSEEDISEEEDVTYSYVIDGTVPVPEVSAEAYLVADIETGEVLLSKESAVARPLASITKLMTALVSKEMLNQYRLIELDPNAFSVPYAETGGFAPGDEVQVRTLQYPLLLESSNSVAEALALYGGYDRFIATMNTRARSIGMTQTHFSDPSGVSPQNISTAEDIFTMIQYLYKNEKDILDITRLPFKEVINHRWENNNKFVHLETYLGGKTGQTTAAGQTLVSIFNMQLTEFEKRPVVIVVMKSAERERDVLTLYEYLRDATYFATTRE